MNEMVRLKRGETQHRWLRSIGDKAFESILHLPVLETRPEHFLRVLEGGTVSTKVYLRRIHNFAIDMTWLPPVIVKRQWPKVEFKDKRGVTAEEHRRIGEREKNPELKAFYQLAWHVGASQSDLANLKAEDVDWTNRVISFFRMKTRWRGQQPPRIRFGEAAEAVLRSLPSSGPLFPKVSLMHEKHRAKEFKRRCVGLDIEGITLHSYRYAWAERAKTCGYPERFAQLALGHNSKAVHRAYARKAQVTVPSLEDYEAKIVPFNAARAAAASPEPDQQTTQAVNS